MAMWKMLTDDTHGAVLNKQTVSRALAIVAATALLSACSAAQDITAQDVSVPVPAAGTSAPDIGSALGESDNADATDGQGSTDSDSQAGSEETNNSEQNGTDTISPDTVSMAGNTSDALLIANAAAVSCSASLDTFRDTMLAMVNASRQAGGHCGDDAAPATGVVQWNDELELAARNHAIDMATVNFFNHTGSDGLGVADRAEAAGYDWRAVGENIAAGQHDIAGVHQEWLESPGHCRNIMNALYTEIGAACVVDSSSNFSRYWVVVFGDQR